MKKVTQKKMTIEDVGETVVDLSNTVTDLSKNVDGLVETINDLAIMTANGFKSVDTRLDSLEEEVKDLGQNIKATRRDMLNMGDKFVTHHMFDELASRVYLLEKKKTNSK